MKKYETQTRYWNGSGLSPLERKMATYLDVEIVNARRRNNNEFDVEIDYIAPGDDGTTGWMPLVLLYLEWKRRPMEIGALVEAAGGCSSEECVNNWNCVRDLDDDVKYLGMCHGVWAVVQAQVCS